MDGNDLDGSLNMICERPADVRKPIMVADCGGTKPEVMCDCCTKCCSGNEPCNDDMVVPRYVLQKYMYVCVVHAYVESC